jgi:UDP-N-acetylmuramate--alanine ligase
MLKELLERNGRKLPVFLAGIGGIGVSGIAKILREDGHHVSGSDLKPSPVTDDLARLGVPVAFGQRAENVPGDAALLVCSAALKPDHPELAEARRRGIPVLKYAQVLGRLMAGRRGIAVAGTHGKTTTTAMIAHVLVQEGLDPTMVVGGNIPALGGTSRVGRSDLMVAEACEYDRSFLNLHPTYAVVTNIEEDHLDYYKDLREIRDAFRCFGALVPPRGRLFTCAEDRGAVLTLSSLDAPLTTYAIDVPADYRAVEVALAGGRPRYALEIGGARACDVALAVPGRHNVLNSLAAIAVAGALGVAADRAARAIASFGGVNRRFHVLHDADGIAVVDDYAHHPTEVRTAILAARERYPGGRVIAVFQPHQHSRTRFLLREFARALELADRVILPDIYFSRDSEADRQAVSSADLVRALKDEGVDARHIPDFDAIARFAAHGARRGDTILTMGAGDIYRVAHSIGEVLLAGAKARQEDDERSEAETWTSNAN